MYKKFLYLRIVGILKYNALGALELIIKRQNCNFSKKEIEKILNEIGERPHRSQFKQIWDTYHGDKEK